MDEKSIPPELNKKNASLSWKKIIILIACIVTLFVILITFYPWDTTCGGFEVYTIDESQIPNGTIIHLTENDFSVFPKMAPFIRDAQYTTEKCSSSKYDSKKCIGKGIITCDEERRGVFGKYQTKSYNESSHTYFDEKYLEYKGVFYFITQSYYA